MTTALTILLSTFTLDQVFEGSTTMVNWVISVMNAVITFITGNPIVLVLFYVSLISFAVGILFRIWRSVG